MIGAKERKSKSMIKKIIRQENKFLYEFVVFKAYVNVQR